MKNLKKISILLSTPIIIGISSISIFLLNKNNQNTSLVNLDSKTATLSEKDSQILASKGRIKKIDQNAGIKKRSFTGVVIEKEHTDELYMWGSNIRGKLGLGDEKTDDNYSSPQHVSSLPLGRIKHLSLGTDHAGVVVTNDSKDTLYVWGSNHYEQNNNSWKNNFAGQLGLGHEHDVNAPTAVTFKNDDESEVEYSEIKSISFAGWHSLVVLVNKNHDGNNNERDEFWSFGDNEHGSTGWNEGTGFNPPVEPVKIIWWDTTFVNYSSIVEVKSDFLSSYIRVINGGKEYIKVFGRGDSGQFGISENEDFDLDLHPVLLFKLWNKYIELPENMELVEFSLGNAFAGAIMNDGSKNRVYVWGTNKNGRLGIDSTDITPNIIPVEITDKFSDEVIDIEFGQTSSFAITEDDSGKQKFYSWGDNSSGQLGLELKAPVIIKPTQSSFFRNYLDSGATIEHMAPGYSSTVVLNDNGVQKLFTFGSNLKGSLGIGVKSRIDDLVNGFNYSTNIFRLTSNRNFLDIPIPAIQLENSTSDGNRLFFNLPENPEAEALKNTIDVDVFDVSANKVINTISNLEFNQKVYLTNLEPKKEYYLIYKYTTISQSVLIDDEDVFVNTKTFNYSENSLPFTAPDKQDIGGGGNNDGGSSNIGLIIGASLGGIAFVGLIGFLGWFFKRKKIKTQ